MSESQDVDTDMQSLVKRLRNYDECHDGDVDAAADMLEFMATLHIKQRDAWRAACRYMYEVIGEGGAKGRPMDLIGKADYRRIIEMVGKAELLEESE